MCYNKNVKVLLDTNIIIYRESDKVINKSIGYLFYWLDNLHYDKYISKLSLTEIKAYQDQGVVETFSLKMQSYNMLPTISNMDQEYKNLLKEYTHNKNDEIDNNLLYELYIGRVNYLITEDRKLRQKALILNLSDKVFSIEDFLYKCKKENPELIDYDVLSIKKVRFAEVDVMDNFFDNFKIDYPGFENWYKEKQDKEAYVCYQDSDLIGFLYIKPEFENEPYNDINPQFQPKKRLKVGTFKVCSSGFRLGERFLKIIFDNAKLMNVDEIYVTLFNKREELNALLDLFKKWGFEIWGNKGDELVLVKDMKNYQNEKSVKYNFPLLKPNRNKYFLPIEQHYHTNLIPDAILSNESEILQNTAHRYALEKVYISWTFKNCAKPGDRILIYRKGDTGGAAYTAVVSAIGVIQEVISEFKDKSDFLRACQNRSIFTNEELENFWTFKRVNLKVIKFILVKPLNKKVVLKKLWDENIVIPYGGPRTFDLISDENYDKILKLSETEE